MSFFYMTKKSRQKFKYFENEKSFQSEIKKHFSSFLKGLSVAKNCLRLESTPLMKANRHNLILSQA